jgi:hypothetical protein
MTGSMGAPVCGATLSGNRRDFILRFAKENDGAIFRGGEK